jgi:hypothetical protein
VSNHQLGFDAQLHLFVYILTEVGCFPDVGMRIENGTCVFPRMVEQVLNRQGTIQAEWKSLLACSNPSISA